MRFFVATLLSALAPLILVHASATLPANKIRGVNLGGLFVSEPWLMTAEWRRMGCSAYTNERDCMKGNSSAQTGFESHWTDWIVKEDLQNMTALGLNSIRVPIGYWIVESTVDRSTEYFPTGGFSYLRRLCSWASELGLNVLLDLHGLPGAQQAETISTGQSASVAKFVGREGEYERAYEVLRNLTEEVHTDAAFSSVFAIEVINEPVQSVSQNADVVAHYYPGAMAAIRDTEAALGISCSSSSTTTTIESRFARHRRNGSNLHHARERRSVDSTCRKHLKYTPAATASSESSTASTATSTTAAVESTSSSSASHAFLSSSSSSASTIALTSSSPSSTSTLASTTTTTTSSTAAASSSSASSTIAGQKDCLTIIYPDYLWWAGNPVSSLLSTVGTAFDDHQYPYYALPSATTRQEYLNFTCHDSRTSNQPAGVSPILVGEWSLASNVDGGGDLRTDGEGAEEWYKRWAAAQMGVYEEAGGWFWWTWKTDTLNDYRWDYQIAVQAGVLPSTAGDFSTTACDGVV
ncbi:hypothetical protein JCM8547_001074 [Rhodosporidiobolus lusitaniae]